MSIPPLLILFLLSHVTADFYLQLNKMAEEKHKSYVWLTTHALIHIICMASVLFGLVLFGVVEYTRSMLWIILSMGGFHLLIDVLKGFVIRRKYRLKKIFTIDQVAHLSFVFLVWQVWGKSLTIDDMSAEFSNISIIILGLLIIVRPIGMLIESGDVWDIGKHMISSCEIDAEDEVQLEKAASRMVGYLERMIIYFLMLCGQFGAIAFVIAAKSIAKISENKDKNMVHLQRNYYVLGTLLSVTSVFAVAILLGLISIT